MRLSELIDQVVGSGDLRPQEPPRSIRRPLPRLNPAVADLVGPTPRVDLSRGSNAPVPMLAAQQAPRPEAPPAMPFMQEAPGVIADAFRIGAQLLRPQGTDTLTPTQNTVAMLAAPTGLPQIASGIGHLRNAASYPFESVDPRIEQELGSAFGDLALGGLGVVGMFGMMPGGRAAEGLPRVRAAAAPEAVAAETAAPRRPIFSGLDRDYVSRLEQRLYNLRNQYPKPPRIASDIRETEDLLRRIYAGETPIGMSSDHSGSWMEFYRLTPEQRQAWLAHQMSGGNAEMSSARPAPSEPRPDLSFLTPPEEPMGPITPPRPEPRLPGRASDGSVLPVRPTEPFRNSLRGGSDDLNNATRGDFRGPNTRPNWPAPAMGQGALEESMWQAHNSPLSAGAARGAEGGGRGTPSLTPAIRINGRIFEGPNHQAIRAEMPADLANVATFRDAGFVTERGRFLSHADAADYARNFGLLNERGLAADSRYRFGAVPSEFLNVKYPRTTRGPLRGGSDDLRDAARRNPPPGPTRGPGIPMRPGTAIGQGALEEQMWRAHNPPPPPPQGINGYHGSPHDFDRFDSKYMGTGQGAQSYGKGHYIAEAEPVAIDYRDQLAGQDKGHMYQVRINSTPENFLDLDSPVSAQSPHIRSLLERGLARPRQVAPDTYDIGGLRFEREGQRFRMYRNGKRTGETFASIDEAHQRYGDHPDRMMAGDALNALEPDQVKQAELLRNAGAHGVRYLDQGSRQAGQGTRNYVVMRDDILNITRKYGLPLGLFGGQAALSRRKAASS